MKPGAPRLAIRLLFAAAGVVVCGIAFFRGNHLLGPAYGVIYLAVALGLLGFLARAATASEKTSFIWAAFVAVLSLPVSYALAFPASINPDMQFFIDKQAIDRATRAELAEVLAADPAFGDLSVSSVHLKVVNLTIRGSIRNRSDLDRLRSRIAEECPTTSGCVLRWDVMLREPAEGIDGLDSEVFRRQP